MLEMQVSYAVDIPFKFVDFCVLYNTDLSSLIFYIQQFINGFIERIHEEPLDF